MSRLSLVTERVSPVSRGPVFNDSGSALRSTMLFLCSTTLRCPCGVPIGRFQHQRKLSDSSHSRSGVVRIRNKVQRAHKPLTASVVVWDCLVSAANHT